MKEAIILAGGLGTRLKKALPDLPKCMAPVAGRPFISYVIDSLRMQGIQKFIFSLGYKYEIIESYLKSNYPTLDYKTVIENEPLGTGGAIKLALNSITSENTLIANGDTLFKIKCNELSVFHLKSHAECTLALKHLQNFDRYGVVETNSQRRIISFKEKQFYDQGLINGGIYLLNKLKFLHHSFPTKFSFEKDYLEAKHSEIELFGCLQNGYFIDIGVPQDYLKAQDDLKNGVLDLKQIDKSWTLLLDRDGVINDEKQGEYVLNWDQFIFSEGVLEAIKKLGEHFGRILIISNQRGVGKELMTEADLKHIHSEMVKKVILAGGKIDKIYYCLDKNDRCFDRKPNPGMALQAISDFPDMDLQKSIMVGNKPSDMRFGRSAGAFTVFLATTNPQQPFPHPDIDLRFNSLADFAKAIES